MTDRDDGASPEQLGESGSCIRPVSQLWAPPDEFDDYEVMRPLGQGSMGNVYLAEDRVLTRLVAVKFIAALEPNVEARQRFLIEARAAARVQHPNVVSIYRVGEIDGRPYLVTEFARGRTLDRLPRPVPTAEALAIGLDLARGLAAAHRKGVLHCDIKSANVIVTDEGSAKLLDFGLATLLKVVPGSELRGAGESALSEDPAVMPVPVAGGHPGTISGTPDTMAPEIWGGAAPTRRSDIYSLGAVLYELCSGATPFHDVAPEELARAVSGRDAPGLLSRAPGVDPRLAEILDRCLRRAPSERFASGDELRQALEQLERTVAGAPVPEGNPYRGLRAFDVQHRALFFGRSAEIGVLVDRLRTESFLVVAGDSGVGKSSICRAGVLPVVAEGGLGGARIWSTCTLTPGKHPRAALASALAERLDVTAELVAEWIGDSGVLAHELGKRLANASTGLLIFIDQAEELHTLSDRDEAERVDAALGALIAQVPGVRVLATVRADFLARVAALPALGEALERALYFLRPLPPERVREIIVGPAQATHVRFESEALVETLVDATARAEGGLPLLQFALAELWEARSVSTGVISEAALAIMGGVAGALSRHGDAVLAAMRSPLRAEARRMLLRLVTLDNTRIRRSEAELRADVEPARSALDALVRARLLVAQDGEDGSAYELAHEVLVQGWTTLRRWLVEDAEAREVRERLAGAAAEWARLRRAPEALWSGRQLAEIARVAPRDLTEGEGAFLAASARATTRGKWLRRAAIAAVPLLIAVGYSSVVITQERARSRAVAGLVVESQAAIDAARVDRDAAATEAATAYRLFDALDLVAGERSWRLAREHEAGAGRSFRQATQILEHAYATDPERADVRRMLGEVLFERALGAEKAWKTEERDDLVERLRIYDADGALMKRWNQPGSLLINSDPPGAAASLLRFEPAPDGRLVLVPVRDLGKMPITGFTLEKGSYLVQLAAEGVAEVRYPVLVNRGEQVSIRVELPPTAAVPPGFVYVPEGRFLFGCADEGNRTGFFATVPLHEVRLEGYLIQRTEVTYASWLEYLRALGPEERAQRTPSAAAKLGSSGALQVTEERGGAWRITLQPSTRVSTAREGEPLRYEGRSRRAEQDWRRFPVSGISATDATAYAAWLDATKRAPGARLCTGLEWEKAARGADAREYPHGDHLDLDDASFDSTYGREAMGPDEVGSHPASRSPFGLDDMAGNIFEWTTSSLVRGEYVVRGGSYFHDPKTLRIPNRNASTPVVRDTNVGLRLCASLVRG
ncbi:MAG: bifunctional serine/threonine-protein kinase/formylglycine-generating enzyme family protein [Byssovorax sp.]